VLIYEALLVSIENEGARRHYNNARAMIIRAVGILDKENKFTKVLS
jgi:hypothetical protein